MKLKFNLKKKIICLLLVFSFAFILNVSADSGWDTSYDSGSSSSSSWGGSSSYNWSDSSSSSDIGFTGFIIIVIIIIIVNVIFLIFSKSKNNISYYEQYPNVDAEKIKSFLPNYTVESLKKIFFANFVQVQDAWMNFEYEKLRELCTDELYNSYVTELETLKLKNGQNIMSDYECITVKIFDVIEENETITVKAYMKIKFYDYVINTKTNEVMRGNKFNKIINNYEMTFVKNRNDISKETKCPNCGAEININTSGICEYCRSTLVKDSGDFVLSKKTNVNKR